MWYHGVVKVRVYEREDGLAIEESEDMTIGEPRSEDDGEDGDTDYAT